MVIFNSYVSLPEGNKSQWYTLGLPWLPGHDLPLKEILLVLIIPANQWSSFCCFFKCKTGPWIQDPRFMNIGDHSRSHLLLSGFFWDTPILMQSEVCYSLWFLGLSLSQTCHVINNWWTWLLSPVKAVLHVGHLSTWTKIQRFCFCFGTHHREP